MSFKHSHYGKSVLKALSGYSRFLKENEKGSHYQNIKKNIKNTLEQEAALIKQGNNIP